MVWQKEKERKWIQISQVKYAGNSKLENRYACMCVCTCTRAHTCTCVCACVWMYFATMHYSRKQEIHITVYHVPILCLTSSLFCFIQGRPHLTSTSYFPKIRACKLNLVEVEFQKCEKSNLYDTQFHSGSFSCQFLEVLLFIGEGLLLVHDPKPPPPPFCIDHHPIHRREEIIPYSGNGS